MAPKRVFDRKHLWIKGPLSFRVNAGLPGTSTATCYDCGGGHVDGFRMNLHHVGYAVAEIERAAATYCKRFGYQACTSVIHDPQQTAYVQFFRLPGDQTYLEFVAPDGPNSKLSNAVAKRIALNHLCFAVDNIDQATEDLRKAGMAVLSKPVPAVAFGGRRISWLLGQDSVPIELLERGGAGAL